jgi:hypothetical protein
MSKIRVAGFAVSLDGFSAGVEQSLSDPLGKRGTETFQWFFHTRTFCSMHGHEGGSAGDIDDEFAHRAMDNFGAFILGRNMFSPVRGPWLDDSWKGWWGGLFPNTGTKRYGMEAAVLAEGQMELLRPERSQESQGKPECIDERERREAFNEDSPNIFR